MSSTIVPNVSDTQGSTVRTSIEGPDSTVGVNAHAAALVNAVKVHVPSIPAGQTGQVQNSAPSTQPDGDAKAPADANTAAAVQGEKPLPVVDEKALEKEKKALEKAKLKEAKLAAERKEKEAKLKAKEEARLQKIEAKRNKEQNSLKTILAKQNNAKAESEARRNQLEEQIKALEGKAAPVQTKAKPTSAPIPTVPAKAAPVVNKSPAPVQEAAKSAEPLAKVEKSSLVALSQQVAGHEAGVYTVANGSLVVKSGLSSESTFYDSILRREPKDVSKSQRALLKRLAQYLPTYHGSIEITDAQTQSTQAVVLENLTAGYKHASVLDIKLGKQLWDESASAEKRARMDEAARSTTSGKTGIRLTGWQAWDSETNAFVKVGKQFGKSIDVKELDLGLRSFFGLGSEEDAKVISQHVKTPIAAVHEPVKSVERILSDAVLPALKEIQDIVKKLEWRVRGASLLVIYEGDAETLQKGTAKSFPRPGRLTGQTDQIVKPTEFASYNSPAAGQRIVDVRLIDLAHASLVPGKGHDDGFLAGVSTTRSLLEKLAKDARKGRVGGAKKVGVKEAVVAAVVATDIAASKNAEATQEKVEQDLAAQPPLTAAPIVAAAGARAAEEREQESKPEVDDRKVIEAPTITAAPIVAEAGLRAAGEPTNNKAVEIKTEEQKKPIVAPTITAAPIVAAAGVKAAGETTSPTSGDDAVAGVSATDDKKDVASPKDKSVEESNKPGRFAALFGRRKSKKGGDGEKDVTSDVKRSEKDADVTATDEGNSSQKHVKSSTEEAEAAALVGAGATVGTGAILLASEDHEEKDGTAKAEEEDIAAKEKAAAEAKFAEEKVAAEKKAADEYKIALAAKAAEEKAVAEKKAAEEKAAAEHKAAEAAKAAEEKAVAEKRAAEEKAAEEHRAAEASKAAEEKAVAEKKAAEEKAAAEHKAAEESRKAAEQALADKKAAEEKAAAEHEAAERAQAEAREAAERAAEERKVIEAAALAETVRLEKQATEEHKAAQTKLEAEKKRAAQEKQTAEKELEAEKKRAADEKAALQQAAADERKAAEKKQAEERKEAEKQAAEERKKVAAEKAAAEKKTAEEKKTAAAVAAAELKAAQNAKKESQKLQQQQAKETKKAEQEARKLKEELAKQKRKSEDEARRNKEKAEKEARKEAKRASKDVGATSTSDKATDKRKSRFSALFAAPLVLANERSLTSETPSTGPAVKTKTAGREGSASVSGAPAGGALSTLAPHEVEEQRLEAEKKGKSGVSALFSPLLKKDEDSAGPSFSAAPAGAEETPRDSGKGSLERKISEKLHNRGGLMGFARKQSDQGTATIPEHDAHASSPAKVETTSEDKTENKSEHTTANVATATVAAAAAIPLASKSQELAKEDDAKEIKPETPAKDIPADKDGDTGFFSGLVRKRTQKEKNDAAPPTPSKEAKAVHADAVKAHQAAQQAKAEAEKARAEAKRAREEAQRAHEEVMKVQAERANAIKEKEKAEAAAKRAAEAQAKSSSEAVAPGGELGRGQSQKRKSGLALFGFGRRSAEESAEKRQAEADPIASQTQPVAPIAEEAPHAPATASKRSSSDSQIAPEILAAIVTDGHDDTAGGLDPRSANQRSSMDGKRISVDNASTTRESQQQGRAAPAPPVKETAQAEAQPAKPLGRMASLWHGRGGGARDGKQSDGAQSKPSATFEEVVEETEKGTRKYIMVTNPPRGAGKAPSAVQWREPK